MSDFVVVSHIVVSQPTEASTRFYRKSKRRICNDIAFDFSSVSVWNWFIASTRHEYELFIDESNQMLCNAITTACGRVNKDCTKSSSKPLKIQKSKWILLEISYRSRSWYVCSMLYNRCNGNFSFIGPNSLWCLFRFFSNIVYRTLYCCVVCVYWNIVFFLLFRRQALTEY